MSDFVEARYAVIVLRQAEISGAEVAGDMILRLASDFDFGSKSVVGHPSRAAAIKAIKTLARDFQRLGRPCGTHWSEAHSAALAWCKTARD